MHGLGSPSRSSSVAYQPMPNPSPFRLPNPRWLGSDGSCRRSLASYDCLMIDLSGPAIAAAGTTPCYAPTMIAWLLYQQDQMCVCKATLAASQIMLQPCNCFCCAGIQLLPAFQTGMLDAVAAAS